MVPDGLFVFTLPFTIPLRGDGGEHLANYIPTSAVARFYRCRRGGGCLHRAFQLDDFTPPVRLQNLCIPERRKRSSIKPLDTIMAFDLLFLIMLLLIPALFLTFKEFARQERRRKEFGKNPDKLHREYAALKANQKVVDITIKNGYLIAKTKTLFCRNPRTNVKHEIGRFEIHLLLCGNTDDARWFNLDRRLKSQYSILNAPDVNEYGECPVNLNNRILTTINRTLASGEYAAALDAAIAFVETAPVDFLDGFFRDDSHIRYWPIAS